LFTVGFRNILRRIGIETEPLTASGLRLLDAIMANQGSLVLLDADCPLSLVSFGQLLEAAPDSLFVVCSKRITPELLWAAFEAGIHGVLSTRVDVDEAADALIRICHGERWFRFEPGTENPPQEKVWAPPVASDFDASWMFGSAGV
jgi:DNA-binding NarL/FixJ family response regulator